MSRRPYASSRAVRRDSLSSIMARRLEAGLRKPSHKVDGQASTARSSEHLVSNPLASLSARGSMREDGTRRLPSWSVCACNGLSPTRLPASLARAVLTTRPVVTMVSLPPAPPLSYKQPMHCHFTTAGVGTARAHVLARSMVRRSRSRPARPLIAGCRSLFGCWLSGWPALLAPPFALRPNRPSWERAQMCQSHVRFSPPRSSISSSTSDSFCKPTSRSLLLLLEPATCR